MAQRVRKPLLHPREQAVRLPREKPRVPEPGPRRQQQHRGKPPALAGRRPQQPEAAGDFHHLRTRGFRYSPGRGPCAFFQATRDAQINNRAARCGAHPICARYQTRRTQRAPAGCGNKHNRSRRKSGGPDQPCQISGPDRRRRPPRPFADRGGRSENWAPSPTQPTKKRRCRRCPEKAEASLS